MATYRLRTFADIVSRVREEIGIQSTDTTAINRIKASTNIVYQELIAENNWHWLQGAAQLVLPAYIATGTASVVAGSSIVTLTVAPGGNKRGYYFAADGFSEIYPIESSSGTTIKLETPYNGVTNTTSTYRIWTDKAALPIDCKEITEAWHDHYTRPLEKQSRQEFRRIAAQGRRAEGLPQWYHVGNYQDPLVTSTIAGMPALVSRASAGIVRTLIFGSAIPSTVAAGSRLRISSADKSAYNGDVIVQGISTTSTANDTLVYVGTEAIEDIATADSNLSVALIESQDENARYREMFYHPAMYNVASALSIDYTREAPDLENDTDEPLIPQEDRAVLLYGVLHREWSRQRNPEEAARNLSLYNNKLAKMQGKLQDNMDKPRLAISSQYLGRKRSTARGQLNTSTTGAGFSGASGAIVSGTPNTVATFNGSGNLEGSATISTTELGYLDGVSSSVQTQLTTNATAIASEATTRATADTAEAAARAAADTSLSSDIADVASDLATHEADEAAHGAVSTNTASAIVARDASGDFAAGMITADLTGDVTGNVSGTAASITGNLTGDITSTGMATAIAAGVIVDADVNASAALARTKLASGTNYRILANDSSGVMSENAALTAKTVIIADANGQLSGIAPGSANNVLKSDGTDWTSGSAPVSSLSVTGSKTSNYTATTSDDVVLCNATSGSFTVTLYTAVGNSGKQIRIKRTDQTLANSVTIDGNASETIDGALTKLLMTQYEEFLLVSDGSNWHVLAHVIPAIRTNYAPAVTGFGSYSNSSAYWQRVGSMMRVQGTFTSGTQTGVLATIPLPTGATVGTTSINNTTSNPGPMCGQYTNSANNNQFGYLITATGTSTSNIYFGATLGSGTGLFLTPVLANAAISGVPVVAYSFDVPITNWEG